MGQAKRCSTGAAPLIPACCVAHGARTHPSTLLPPTQPTPRSRLPQVYSYSGDFEGVLRVWRRLGAAGFAPTAKLWGSLLVACSAAGQLEQAAIFWWEMKQLHVESQGGVLNTDNVCAMMTACNAAGQVRPRAGARAGPGLAGARQACGGCQTGCNQQAAAVTVPCRMLQLVWVAQACLAILSLLRSSSPSPPMPAV